MLLVGIRRLVFVGFGRKCLLAAWALHLADDAVAQAVLVELVATRRLHKPRSLAVAREASVWIEFLLKGIHASEAVLCFVFFYFIFESAHVTHVVVGISI